MSHEDNVGAVVRPRSRSGERAYSIEVNNTCTDETPENSFIENWVDRALALASDQVGLFEVSVKIVNADEIRVLNRDYRQRDYATNVLSFPAGDIEGLPGDVARALGDIVVCASVVEREAVEQGKAPEDHWAHMLVHGTLHLLGYDHEDDDEARVMESLEARILAEGGVADPYE